MTKPSQIAFLFDVFGTCVDWRTTVTNEMHRRAPSTMSVAEWGDFAQEWRNSYKVFTKSRAEDSALPMKSIDQHHFDSLQELLAAWKLQHLWSAEELQDISLVWHRLDPWTDSEKGIEYFNGLGWSCTLSNGNASLLRDLRSHARLDFTHLFGAEDFGTFKPNKAVYLGAVEKLGLSPSQCFMVAAHLADLKAAKGCGYRTIYVERPLEEDWDGHQIEEARAAGFVDLWVTANEDGFLAAVDRLKIEGLV
ncbi:haloacid dehalogenase [Venturia nashicola]|nr:haloacid dehalogenase [Venturia nashicola]